MMTMKRLSKNKARSMKDGVLYAKIESKVLDLLASIVVIMSSTSHALLNGCNSIQTLAQYAEIESQS